jgi:hypothetical protein
MRRRWTAEDLDFLRTHYGLFDIDFCAARLGRTEKAVRVMAGRLFREHARVESARKLRGVSHVASDISIRSETA